MHSNSIRLTTNSQQKPLFRIHLKLQQ